MSLNSKPGALASIKAIADRVLESPDGITVSCPDVPSALKLRQQFNTMRVADRKAMTKVYPAGHPQHGTSVYDCIETKLFGTSVSFKTGFATLKGFKITDNSSGEDILPEEL